MHGGEGIMRVDLTSRISHEDIHPEIKLKNSVQVYIMIYSYRLYQFVIAEEKRYPFLVV